MPRRVGAYLAFATALVATARVATALFAAACAWCSPAFAQSAPRSFEIAPASPPRVLPADYFGTHLQRLRLPPEQRGKFPQTVWPAGQIGSIRIWDSGMRWADIEPAPSRFDFAALDHYVQQAEANAASVMLVLGSPPRWAAARPAEAGPYGPGSISEPADLRDWDHYVETIAKNYKGRIAFYELWNEPYFSDFPKDRGHPSSFFTGSADTMVELARRTRAVLDRVSPQAVLLTPGFTGSTDRLDLFLSKGGARYVGGVAYHYYAETDHDFVALHRQVRAVMERHGLASLPLYNTESGFEVVYPGAPPQPPLGVPLRDEPGAAAQMASHLVLGAFLGLRGYYQYAWDNPRMGMVRTDGRSPTASAAAFASVRRWLSGAELGACTNVAPQVVRCEARRDGTHLSVLWQSAAQAPVRVALPQGTEVLALEDAITGALSVDPRALAQQGLAVARVPIAVRTRSAWGSPPRSGGAP